MALPASKSNSGEATEGSPVETSSGITATATAIPVFTMDEIKQEINDEGPPPPLGETLPPDDPVFPLAPSARAIVQTGRKLYSKFHKCPSCPKSFKQLADYLTHIREHKKVTLKFSVAGEGGRGLHPSGSARSRKDTDESQSNSKKAPEVVKVFKVVPADFSKRFAMSKNSVPSRSKHGFPSKKFKYRMYSPRVPNLVKSVVRKPDGSLEFVSNALEMDDMVPDEPAWIGDAPTKGLMEGKKEEKVDKVSSCIEDVVKMVTRPDVPLDFYLPPYTHSLPPPITKADNPPGSETSSQFAESEFDCSKFQQLEYQQYNPAVDAEAPRNAFACSVCGEQFVTIRAVNLHERKEHPDVEEQPLQCNLCDQVLKNRRSLRSHEIRLHSMPAARELKVSLDPKIGTYQCGVCEPSRAFDTEEQLDYHNQMFHPTGDRRVWVRQYGCEDCGDIFNDIKALAAHRKEAHDFIPEVDELQKYPCPSCEQSFERPYKLAVHRKEEHNDGTFTQPFHCHLCNKGFKTKCGINSHVESAHSDKGPMPFQCQHCGRRYATKHNWRKHVKSHLTGVEYLICSGCGKRYLHTNSLQFHQRTCDGYKAVTRLELELDKSGEYRILEVDGMQQFECKVCSHVTKSRSGFAKHFKNVHFAMGALSVKQQETLVQIYAEAEEVEDD